MDYVWTFHTFDSFSITHHFWMFFFLIYQFNSFYIWLFVLCSSLDGWCESDVLYVVKASCCAGCVWLWMLKSALTSRRGSANMAAGDPQWDFTGPNMIGRETDICEDAYILDSPLQYSHVFVCFLLGFWIIICWYCAFRAC